MEKLYRYQLLDSVQVLVDRRVGVSIGQKRNNLLSQSVGDYVAFIDDDDDITEDYFLMCFKAIRGGFDSCYLRGIITWSGINPEIFEHSIKYRQYKTNENGCEVKYERYPNHLNCIKREIAVVANFPDKSHSEDTEWATQIFVSGLIKSEYYDNKIMYNYQYEPNK